MLTPLGFFRIFVTKGGPLILSSQLWNLQNEFPSDLHPCMDRNVCTCTRRLTHTFSVPSLFHCGFFLQHFCPITSCSCAKRTQVKEKVEIYYFSDMFYIFSLNLYLHPNEPEILTFFSYSFHILSRDWHVSEMDLGGWWGKSKTGPLCKEIIRIFSNKNQAWLWRFPGCPPNPWRWLM